MRLTTVATDVGEAPIMLMMGFGFQIRKATASALDRNLEHYESPNQTFDNGIEKINLRNNKIYQTLLD